MMSCTPVGSVVYAIGDIHGRIDLLRRLLEDIRRDSDGRQPGRRVLVFLGDYLTRGQDSPAVIETVMAPPLPGFETVPLKGNHEDCLLRLLDGDLAAGALWLDYGGFDAMRDYGVTVADTSLRDASFLENLRQRLSVALPQRHLAFLRALPVAHREGGYCFVHAGVRPGVPLEQQSDEDRMWIRDRFLDSDEDHGAIVVHGHSITPEPAVRHNRIGIDTGAYASGVLTCLVLEGSERVFLQT